MFSEEKARYLPLLCGRRWDRASVLGACQGGKIQRPRSTTCSPRRSECACIPTILISSMSKPRPASRSDYRAWRAISTRWMDNDAYGHVNNVVYYSWFDTAVNAYLIEHGALDLVGGGAIGLVVETHCNYFAPLSFPQTVDIGLRVAHRGTSSVRYELGIFGSGDTAAAQGHFVHVYVDAQTRKPTPLPPTLLSVLDALL